MPWAIAATAASAAGNLASGIIGANASNKAASQAAAMQRIALQNQSTELNYQNALMNPFVTAGQKNLGQLSNYWQGAQNQLNGAYSNAVAAVPKPMTQAQLEATPGYQFNLNQGLRATQASAAAKGLGVSGAAMQAAGKYATGLADSTYQNQFANQQQLYSDAANNYGLANNATNSIYNYLQGPAALGENGAANAGYQGNTAMSNQSSTLTNLGNAQAAGITGSTSALTNGLSSAFSSPLQYLGIQSALNNSQAMANALGNNGGGVDSTSTLGGGGGWGN